MKKIILILSLFILSLPKLSKTEPKNDIYLKSSKAAAFIIISYYLGKGLGYFAENTPEIMLLPSALITGLNIYNKINGTSSTHSEVNLGLICAACVSCLHLKTDTIINPENHISRLTTGIESSLLFLELKNYVLNLYNQKYHNTKLANPIVA